MKTVTTSESEKLFKEALMAGSLLLQRCGITLQYASVDFINARQQSKTSNHEDIILEMLRAGCTLSIYDSIDDQIIGTFTINDIHKNYPYHDKVSDDISGMSILQMFLFKKIIV